VASLIGKEIGKYRITERLGQGGMAEVYAGVHTHLDRKVAVKVLHSYLLEGGDFVARFKREAKAVANLRHPNIVQVYDFDIQDDLIFMVMEYVDGVNLHTKLVEVGNKGERMPIKLIGSIINDIASALDYAHTKDMLHRDIKPSNIMLDSENKAYLTDFGIAKLLSDQKFTATGTLVGTPAYMSPEQSLGDDVSKESDIYSLGVVAFEMLTGQVPYDAKTPIGIVHKQINDPIPNMSELVDGVPGTAQEVIDRALAKTPESRFSSAEDLVGALRTALQALESTDPIAIPQDESPTVVDDVLEAPTVTMKAEEMEKATVVMEAEKKKEEPPAKEPKKKAPKEKLASKPRGEKKKVPLWVYIAGGVALLAVVGVILTQVLDINLPGLSSGTSTTSIPGAVELFIDVDHTDQGLSVLDNSDDGNYEIVDVGRDQAYRTGNGDVLTAPDGNLAGDYYIFFDIQDDRMYELPEGSETSISITYLDQGRDTFSVDYDAHSGGPLGDGRFKLAGRVEKTDTGEFLTAEFKLADAFFANLSGGDFRIGDDSDGAETIRSVRVIWIPTDDSSPSDTSQGDDGIDQFNAGVAFFEDERYEEAIGAFDQALAAGYVNWEIYDFRGRTNRNLGNLEESVEDFTRAIEEDEDNFWGWSNRGEDLIQLGDLYGAIDDFTIAFDKGADHWWVFYKLGEAYYLTEEDQFKDEAHAALDQAIALEPTFADSRRLRGKLKLYRFGDPAAALEDLNIAVEYSDLYDPRAISVRGEAYHQLGEWGLCIDDFNKAFGMDDIQPRYYWLQGDCLAGNGDTFYARGRYEEFLELVGDDPEYEEQVLRIQTWLDEN